MASDLTLARALELADGPTKEVLQRLSDGVASVETEMERFRADCRRFDNLYYPNDIGRWGADLWNDDPSATTEGRSHVSVNTGKVYVDLPAALKAFPPVVNMAATDTTDRSRKAAEALERVYKAWAIAESWQLKLHQACIVSGLYGRTAARPYWDEDRKRPCIEIIERPQRMWLGYAADRYKELEWAAFQSRMTPNAVRRAYRVNISERPYNGMTVPVVTGFQMDGSDDRTWLQFEGDPRIDVWDFWYREYDGSKLVVYNVVVAGNQIVRDITDYPDYDGDIPVLPLYNSYVPNIPNGRSDLYDVEPLIREHYERLTSGSQMIASATAGDYWQLVGEEAPSRVPPTLQPRRNEIAAPGPGNRIEPITPFIAQFQLADYLKRLDYDKETITGLNDLLLGHAPASVLGSSRAINALFAQYHFRQEMPLLILYDWIRRTWEMSLSIWTKHDRNVKKIVDQGGGVLDIRDPALSPRDEMDTAMMAINLKNAGLWAPDRGMDATGVDDIGTEMQLIREYNSDATLSPDKVQVMAQLLATLQQLGIQPPQNAQNQAQQQAGSAQQDLRTALGQATPTNTEGQQAPGEVGQLPPGAVTPGATPPGAPFAQGPAGQGPVLQTMVQGGKASGRLLSQTQLGRR